MDDIKIQRDDPGFLGSIFGKKRKSYSEIMNTFLTVKDDLKKLIKNNVKMNAKNTFLIFSSKHLFYVVSLQ